MVPIKTLLACWDEATEAALAILGSQFLVTVVHTIAEAERHLATGDFELIVATIRFDESRPLDLLPIAARFNVPIALVRFGVSRLPQDLVAGAFVAARCLGCMATLDLTSRSGAIGSEAATAELRISLQAAAHHIPHHL